jgi:hypothetical protein
VDGLRIGGIDKTSNLVISFFLSLGQGKGQVPPGLLGRCVCVCVWGGNGYSICLLKERERQGPDPKADLGLGVSHPLSGWNPSLCDGSAQRGYS